MIPAKIAALVAAMIPALSPAKIPALVGARIPALLMAAMTATFGALLLLAPSPMSGEALAAAQILKFGDFHLAHERIGPGLWRFQISVAPPDQSYPWAPSIMLTSRSEWNHPPQNPVEARIQVTGVDSPDPAFTIRASDDDGVDRVVFTIGPYAPDGQLAGITFHGESYTHVVGLGSDFRFSAVNINHLGHVVMPGSPFGSILEKDIREQTSGIQAPICYVMGPGRYSAAIFINETRPLMWDFVSTPWFVGPTGPLGPKRSIDFFVLMGPDLPALRRILMSLIGRPPLPPKSVFSPWVLAADKPTSQNWSDYLASLGNLKGDAKSLSVILPNQPDTPPLTEAAAAGLNLLVTESPYIPADSAFFSDLDKRGFLVRQGTSRGPALRLDYRGKQSGLIDYTNPAAASYWHSLNRVSNLIQGAQLFYLVGGEPEVYSNSAWYAGVSDPGVHTHYAWSQRFSLKWMEGIQTGLATQIFGPGEIPRLFLLSRAGLAGLSRYGAGLFTSEPNVFFATGSGQARSHLNMSGVDYYSTDISSMLGDLPFERGNVLYESWLAKNVLLNLPLVLPARMMSEPWAKLNLNLKTKLEPYYYSLAYLAWRDGDPVSAPLFFYFQDDLRARESAFETMLGPWLLVAAGVNPGAETLKFHLPAGRWYDYYGGDVIEQPEGGEYTLASKLQGLHVSPLLLRSGAIIPTIWDSAAVEPVFHVIAFPALDPTSFIWYEDEGKDNGYQSGKMAITAIELNPASQQAPLSLTIRARESSDTLYSTADNRVFIVELVGIGNVAVAELDGQTYTRVAREEKLQETDSGWLSTGNGRLLFKTPALSTAQDHSIVIK